MTNIDAALSLDEAGYRMSRERPFAFALLCSGAVHVVLCITITMALALLPQPPATTPGPTLRALLVAPSDLRPLPDPLGHLVAPTLAPVLLPLLLPDTPVVPTPAAPNPIARTASSTVLPPPNETRVLDPDGSVTLRVITDAQRAGRLASGLSDRYHVQPDRLPRLTAALIVPYPSEARQSRSSARIAAVVDVDEQGRIAAARLVPDDSTFSPVVMEALKDARFAPAEVATHSVPYWAVLEFDFAIPTR
jgi:hypothetical protein